MSKNLKSIRTFSPKSNLRQEQILRPRQFFWDSKPLESVKVKISSPGNNQLRILAANPFQKTSRRRDVQPKIQSLSGTESLSSSKIPRFVLENPGPQTFRIQDEQSQNTKLHASPRSCTKFKNVRMSSLPSNLRAGQSLSSSEIGFLVTPGPR